MVTPWYGNDFCIIGPNAEMMFFFLLSLIDFWTNSWDAGDPKTWRLYNGIVMDIVIDRCHYSFTTRGVVCHLEF